MSRVAAISLSTEFFAPGTTTVPDSGPLPRTAMTGASAFGSRFSIIAHQYARLVESGGRMLIRRWPDTPEQRERLLAPRDDLVLEARESAAHAPNGSERFRQADGPFTAYERTVTTDHDERQLVETTRYAVTIPWFGWLFRWPVRRVLAREGSHRAWWAPPDRLDETQLLVVGLLAAASMSAAFVNTLFTQTVNFAADDFGISDTGIGVAGAVVRAGILIALPAAIIADRIGRRRVIVAVAWLGPLLSLLGALAPSFVVLVPPRPWRVRWGSRLPFLVGVVASEEMPRNSRAYAVSILAMAAGFGAGVAVLSLRFADIGESGWRYVVPDLGGLVHRGARPDPPAARDPPIHRRPHRTDDPSATIQPPPAGDDRRGRLHRQHLHRAGQLLPEPLPGRCSRLLRRHDRASSRSPWARRPASV